MSWINDFLYGPVCVMPGVNICCLCLIIFTAEEDHRRQNALLMDMQRTCMRRLIDVQPCQESFPVELYGDVRDPCSWVGVKCAMCIVRGMQWGMLHSVAGFINIAWLPTTTREVRLEGQMIHTEVNTRLLPLDLVSFIALDCGVKGSLNIHHLPPNLQNFNLSNNSITGNVSLTNLPHTLEWLDLCNNKILKVYGTMHDLPKVLRNGSFYSRKFQVKYISIDGSNMDYRITCTLQAKEDLRKFWAQKKVFPSEYGVF